MAINFKSFLMGRSRLAGAVTTAALALSACVSPVAGPNGNYAAPIGTAPVTSNETPYSEALACLGSFSRSTGQRSPRIAVGRIADYTGAVNFEGGARLTQGASLMATSAFAKAGVSLVERFDTSVSELELRSGSRVTCLVKTQSLEIVA